MEGYEIKKADFEKQKTELKRFAQQPVTSTELDKFSTDGQWNDFFAGGIPGVLTGHKVTGEEMNSLVVKLQSCFAEVNERGRKVIKEFGQVYETFEALDRGYIQGILISVKSAEEASKEAKEAQKDINDTMKALKGTVSKLKSFKDEMKSYEHLKDVDQIWLDLEKFGSDLEDISARIESKEKALKSEILGLTNFTVKMKSQEHIGDIDELWNKVEESEKKIISSLEDINKITNDLKNADSILRELKKTIDGLEHLSDIDSMWKGIQEIEETIPQCISDIKRLNDDVSYLDEIRNIIHLKDIDEEWEYAHLLGGNLDKLSEDIIKMENDIVECQKQINTSEDENNRLKQRLKLAYIIAGGAFGLSVLQMILSVLGVL